MIHIKIGEYYGTLLKLTDTQISSCRIDVFPTTIMRFDTSRQIQQQDYHDMIKDIDDMIDNTKYMQIDSRTPQHQSMPILFNDQYVSGDHWKKLANSFSYCCYLYTQVVTDYVNNQDKLELTGQRAWFYKGYRSINCINNNPWHNHMPAFLSGVFYLRIPAGYEHQGGTLFQDPRAAHCLQQRDCHVPPMEYSWVIFPSWMQHCSGQCDTEDPRYVIAADCYVRVKL